MTYLLLVVHTVHRALEDVKAMMHQVFQTTSFSMVLKAFTLRNVSQIFLDWEAKRSDYVAEYRRGTTKAMADCLVKLKILSNKLQPIFN